MTTEIENTVVAGEGNSKRPGFLSVLCVLSFIWEGLMILCFLIALLCSGMIFEKIEEMVANQETTAEMGGAQIQGLDQILEMGAGKFSVGMGIAILIFVAMLVSVIQMWKLKRMGFYIYAGINALFLAYNLYQPNYVGAVLDALFIGLYAMNFKHLKN